ncbi:MAG TPA: neutral zinc metallopeptidase [Thiobacillaceae bacterium]|nr:neutral zinc metallopeptidase [Thiobacillaceae bacterium]HNH87900.1 neutral zinc metallopeptidase [Thiobacillaceae bacterium]
MRWESGRRSDNIEDRRGMGLGGKGLVGGGIGTVVIALIALFMGVDPGTVLNQIAQAPPVEQGVRAPADPREEKLKEFVSVVLADTEDTWGELFRQSGGHYEQPRLVLFSGAVQSACGQAQSAMGPFYCPGDHKLYLDMGFFDDLARRYNAPGDFAQAYVIAHEVGHHVQTLLGISDKVQAARQRAGEVEANRLQVRMELQADCLAGIWAHHADKARGILEQGDVEEALAAASGVGDDRLQQQARGHVVPDSFTHGSSEQRMRWFSIGAKTGDPGRCDTFKAARL